MTENEFRNIAENQSELAPEQNLESTVTIVEKLRAELQQARDALKCEVGRAAFLEKILKKIID